MESVVHEYSVLYSTRVIQKDKRWSDGILRFYEFNNKLEILSDEMNLIATDFYPKNKPNPTGGVFKKGFEYKFSNGKIMLEIDDYIRSYKRDISKLFKKSITPIQQKATTPIVKKESELDALGSIYASPRVRRVGLSRNVTPRLTTIKKEPMETIIKREPGQTRIKKEPVDTSINIESLEVPKVLGNSSMLNRPVTGPKSVIGSVSGPRSAVNESANSSEASISKVLLSGDGPKSTLDKPVKGTIPPKSVGKPPRKLLGKKLKETLQHTLTIPPTRILPKSSKHFQHLKRESSTASSTDESLGTMKVKAEPEKEPLGNTVPQDISDFEEEEKFFDMIRELREKPYNSGDEIR